MRNYFTFGEYDSRDFGVFIARDGVYNAPRKVYNSYSVPGRNGDLHISQNRMENIEVIYPACIYAGFDANLTGLRNALMSQDGYVRIMDSYHPDEYRLGVYKGDMSVIPTALGDGGTFDIVFDCKPQRFLLSGETPVIYPPGDDTGKNLLSFPYYHSSMTVQGVKYTVNSDGSVSVKCSPSTQYSLFVFKQTFISDLGLQEGDEVRFSCGVEQTTSLYMEIYPYSPPGLVKKVAENEVVTITSQMISTDMSFAFYVGNGQTLDMTLYPMICKASEPAGWQPYYDGSTKIYNPTLFASRPIIKVTPTPTSDNLIPYPYVYSGTITVNGVTFVENEGVITASGTATATAPFNIFNSGSSFTLSEGTYKLSGYNGESGGGIFLFVYYNGSWRQIAALTSSGSVDIEITEAYAGLPLWMYCAVLSGRTVTNARYQPVLLTKANNNKFIKIGSQKIYVANAYPHVIIDSEIQDCYRGINNLNSQVTFEPNEFPMIEPGVNAVEFSADIQSIEITPRWFIV